MSKNTLNIISTCIVILIIVFSITQKDKFNKGEYSDNIVINENGEIKTKADQYKTNILDTVSEANIKNFKKFAQTFEKNDEDNITDSLSKDIFSQYIKYNTSGGMNENDIADITESVLNKKGGVSNPSTYGDIKINTSSTNNLKIYGNDIAIIENSTGKAILALNNKTNKTPYISSIYMEVSKILVTVPVPESLAENHLQIINGLKKYSEGLSMVDQQSTDPAKALLGLNNVKEATDEILVGFDKIRKTIILNKIKYTPDEPGHIWISDNENQSIIKI